MEFLSTLTLSRCIYLETGLVEMVVSSNSFPFVVEGEVVPILCPTYEVYHR